MQLLPDPSWDVVTPRRGSTTRKKGLPGCRQSPGLCGQLSDASTSSGWRINASAPGWELELGRGQLGSARGRHPTQCSQETRTQEKEHA